MTQAHQPRTYRNRLSPGPMASFRVVVKETDLQIHADRSMGEEARDLVLEHRGYLESYIETHPEFVSTLEPWTLNEPAPEIVRAMIDAGRKSGVGPMAAVAGAIAERVGLGILRRSRNVVVENGGDIFMKTRWPMTVGIFAGTSPLSLRVGLQIEPGKMPMGVCTSSGTVGHSLSKGNADAVGVVARSCALADAAATAIGNRVRSRGDISSAVDFGKQISGVEGVVIILGQDIGLWGQLELVPVNPADP